MRLFIASPAKINGYDELKKRLSKTLDGKCVGEENLHMTWLFLGEQVSEAPLIERMHRIRNIMKSSRLSSLGTFGRPPHVLYSSVDDPDIRRQLTLFKKAGFATERFRAHVTLCRIKEIYDKNGFEKIIKQSESMISGTVEPEIGLYESILTPKGPVYKKIISL